MSSKTVIKNGVGIREIKNPAEHQFVEMMKAEGWAPTKRGWPDFFCIHEDGRICLVEVKPYGHHSLKREQEIILNALSKYGIDCYRWDPDRGFRKYPRDIDEKITSIT